jgi:hypothetical protein
MGRFYGMGARRQLVIPLRLDQKEHEALKDAAMRSGVSMVEYARVKIFGYSLGQDHIDAMAKMIEKAEQGPRPDVPRGTIPAPEAGVPVKPKML